ncbi:MAG: recombination mediator RecR [Flavobacteriaceae bacterium]|nr:recombination mediator RecR [Flavobacteriaceae bacterium]
MEFSSKLLEQAVIEVSRLPGIGKRTALRLVLHLLRQPETQTRQLSEALVSLREKILLCQNCHNISDTALCEICANPSRDSRTVCVVEDIRDVLAIENTGQYQGQYHVLGGKISPLDGIGPGQLNIRTLVEKVRLGQIDEIIFALSANIEGDTTNFYIYRQIESFPIKMTTIARGIPVGDELEFTDEVTLGRSLMQRIPFEGSQKIN